MMHTKIEALMTGACLSDSSGNRLVFSPFDGVMVDTFVRQEWPKQRPKAQKKSQTGGTGQLKQSAVQNSVGVEELGLNI